MNTVNGVERNIYQMNVKTMLEEFLRPAATEDAISAVGKVILLISAMLVPGGEDLEEKLALDIDGRK